MHFPNFYEHWVAPHQQQTLVCCYEGSRKYSMTDTKYVQEGGTSHLVDSALGKCRRNTIASVAVECHDLLY